MEKNKKLKEGFVEAILNDKTISSLVKKKVDIIAKSNPALLLNIRNLHVINGIEPYTEELMQIDNLIQERMKQIKAAFEQ